MTDNKMDDGCPSFHFCVHTRTDLVWFLGGDKYALVIRNFPFPATG